MGRDEKKEECRYCEEYKHWVCQNPDSDLYGIETFPDDCCEEFKERSS